MINCVLIIQLSDLCTGESEEEEGVPRSAGA